MRTWNKSLAFGILKGVWGKVCPVVLFYWMNVALWSHFCQMMNNHVGFFSKIASQVTCTYTFVWKKMHHKSLDKTFLCITPNSFSHLWTIQDYCQSRTFLHRTHSRLFPSSGISRDGKCMQPSWDVGVSVKLVCFPNYRNVFVVFFAFWNISVGFFMCQYFVKATLPRFPNKTAMPAMIGQSTFFLLLNHH